MKKANDESPRHFEYYKKQNKNWTVEQCEQAAINFRKSTNWQNIEYYKKQHPELSDVECEQLRLDAIKRKKQNNILNIEYWEFNYSDKTPEEIKEMHYNYVKGKNFQCIEYYRDKFPGHTEDEYESMLAEAKKSYLSKRPDNSGENNPAYHTKTTEHERRVRSPRCIEFYENKFPGKTHDEYAQMLKNHTEYNNLQIKNAVKTTNIEYYLNQGMTDEEARDALRERQTTFSFEKCIEKYGETKGIDVFQKRQNKWIEKLHDTFEHANGVGGVWQSKLGTNIITKLCEYLHIDYPDHEKFITDGKHHYCYDFCWKNKIVEINGDFWHCNPKIYDKNYYNKMINMTAEDKWEYDNAKYECAKQNGYDVFVFWEYDYHNDHDNTINKCIEFLNENTIQ